MAYVLVTDTDLTSVANEIRSKTGQTGQLAFPSGYVTAIRSMQKGTPKAAATYNPSNVDRTIAAGTYLEGAQTIKAVTSSNLSAGNIKAGVTVGVSGLSNVTGTFTNDANASAGNILSGKTAYVNGVKLTGSYNTSGHVSQQSYTEVRSSISMPAMSPGTSTVVTTITIPNDENWYITSAAFSSGYLATLYLNITGTTLTVLAVNDTQATIASDIISVQIEYRKVL
jgi:hypothetical protein